MTIRAMTPEERLRFGFWRDQASDLMPYLSPILFKFRPIVTDEVDSFAVDEGLRCYVNTERVKDWSPKLLATALLHECGHVWSEHAARARELGVSGAQQHQDWNAGADMAINDDLLDAGLTEIKDFLLPSLISQPNHQEAEHYYGVIRAKRAAQQKQHAPQQQSGQPVQDAPGNGGDQPDSPGEGQQDSTANGSNGEQAPQDYTGCGSVSGNGAPCELPDDGGALGAESKAASVADVSDTLDQVAYEIEKHVRVHGRGSIPGGLSDFMDNRLEPPKVPWRTELSSFVRRTIHVGGRGRRSTNRPNRRRNNITLGGQRVIVPGTVKPVLRIALIRDTSGSMSVEDLQMVGNEVEGVARALGIKGPNLLVIDVDSHAHPPRPYAGAATLNIVQGRGGTDMSAGLAVAGELSPAPTLVIVCTDGITGWPNDEPPFPVVGCFIGKASERYAKGAPHWVHTVVVED